MMAAAPEVRLSAEIRHVGEKLSLATLDDMPEIVRLLGRLADLAHAQELELQLLRDMEAGRELRVGVHEAIDTQLSTEGDDARGNVIFKKFRRKS